MKISPGDFVEAKTNHQEGPLVYGFVERIIDSTTNKAVLPRAPRKSTDRFVVRPLVGKTMTPFTDETGAITSDIDPRSEKSVLEVQQAQLFPKESLKQLPNLPGDDADENNVADDDSDFKFAGSAQEKSALVFLYKRLKTDRAFESCCYCGDVGKLMMCETCTASAHLHCQAPEMKKLPDYEWRCHKCLAQPSPLWSAVRFRHLLRRLILEISALDIEGHFAHPVSIWFVVPTYAEKIACPVDLSMIILKVERGCYKSIEQFILDFNTMIENCQTFNEGTPLVEYALDLQKKGADLIKKFRTQLKNEGLSETYSGQLMGMCSSFSSEFQVQKVDPTSISVFGNRALPLSVRNSKGNIGTSGNTNRPGEPICFPTTKPVSLEQHQYHNPLQHNLRRQQNMMMNMNNNNDNERDQNTSSDYEEEKSLLQRAIQLPEHVAKDPNFSFPHPIRVTLCPPNCFQGDLKILYTLDGSHPAKSSSSRLYKPGKPILLAPKTVVLTKEHVEKLFSTNDENGNADALPGSNEQNDIDRNLLLFGEKIVVKAICSLPPEMINGNKDDDRTRSTVMTTSYRFTSPFINYEKAIEKINTTANSHTQQQQRSSSLRNSNHQRRSSTNTKESNIVGSGSPRNNTGEENFDQTNTNNNRISGQRRGRNVHFQDDSSNFSNDFVLIDGILPRAWLKAGWIDVFLDKIEDTASSHQMNSEEIRLYRKVLLRLLLSASSKGDTNNNNNNNNNKDAAEMSGNTIHEEDRKRVLRDYLMFVSMNIDRVQ